MRDNTPVKKVFIGTTVLATVVLLFLLPLKTAADEEVFHAYIIRSDPLVYSGGYWDAYAGCGLSDDTGVTYQWCARYNHEGSYLELEDTERYIGTHTAHLRFLSADGFAYGTDWEKITFACRVTYQGKTEYTEDVWMYIVTTATLVHDLKADPPVELTMLCPRGADPAAERFEVQAGTRLDLTVRQSAVEPAGFLTDLENSEMRFQMVTTITENGKTTVYDSDRGYFPYAVGKGALTARSELWLLANGERNYLVDSREIVIDTYAPSPVGSAKAKQDGSLLRERYNESQKVDPNRAVFSKNQWVSLLEQSGSWWMVLCNGFVGYVPATALNIQTTVEEVSISIPEPTDGANPSFSPAILQGAVTLFPTEPVTWQILDSASGNPYVYANYRYQSGKKYRLVIWLKAAPGYRFPLKNGSPDVTVFVNGRVAKVVTAYEQDPEEVLELSVDYTDHVHNLQKVAQVNPTCTTDGRLTYYRCNCGALYEDYQGQIRITDANWGVIPARGHWESEWMSNGTEHYKYCQRRECMQEIAGTRGSHTGGKATCYAKAVCSVCGHEYGALAAHVPGPAATETEPQICLTCGKILQDAIGHTHSLTEVEKKEATCLEAGNQAYFVCSDCGKWFEDAAGSTEIADPDSVIRPPLGHETSDNWSYDKEFHWRTCTRCGEILDETRILHDQSGENGSCATCGFVPGSKESESAPTAEPDKPTLSPDKPSTGPDAPTEPSGKEPFKIFGMSASQFILMLSIVAGTILAVTLVIVILILARKKKDREQPKT